MAGPKRQSHTTQGKRAGGRLATARAVGEEQMLILTRRVGETVMIGDDVTVTILRVKGHHVRVGINAPKSIAVHHEEIYERIKAERSTASTLRAPQP